MAYTQTVKKKDTHTHTHGRTFAEMVLTLTGLGWWQNTLYPKSFLVKKKKKKFDK